MKKNFALALAAIFALLLASAFADNDIEPADILYERTTIHANSNYDETPLSDAEVTLILNADSPPPPVEISVPPTSLLSRTVRS